MNVLDPHLDNRAQLRCCVLLALDRIHLASNNFSFREQHLVARDRQRRLLRVPPQLIVRAYLRNQKRFPLRLIRLPRRPPQSRDECRADHCIE